MRVRIASTKATQKITKAMQMVAASKLRRAQTAAEAARPYAEKMDAVISNIATAAAGSPGAPVLLAGTGKDQVHLLLVCTGERGLSGAFNSSIVRLARERALALINQGKEVKFFCVGRKGFEQLRRNFEAATICMALVIFCVALVEAMRTRMSLSEAILSSPRRSDPRSDRNPLFHQDRPDTGLDGKSSNRLVKRMSR